MPVLVVPADTPIGVPLVRALAARGGEVRAYATGDGDVGALRAAGALVATGDLDDEGHLDAAMTQAHTVIALHADPLADDAADLDRDLRTTVTAASKAEASRLVVRSVPSATVGDDPLRRVCADIERGLVDVALPTIAVRTSLVDTPSLRDALVSAGVGGHGDVPVAPMHVEDVVAALVALDDARSTAATGHATFRLQGQASTLGAYLDRIGGQMVGRVYVPGTQVPLLAPSLATPWVESDHDGTADLLAFADHRPRPLDP